MRWNPPTAASAKSCLLFDLVTEEINVCVPLFLPSSVVWQTVVMCGIFFCYNRDKPEHPSEACLESLQRRGPDSVSTVSRFLEDGGKSSQDSASIQHVQLASLTFVSTVLSLRGNDTVRQPLEDRESGSLLCWNGEAWKLHGQPFDGNDAEAIFDLLLKSTDTLSHDQALQNILSSVSAISGPFAFVFYDAPHHRIFYGRDVLGRRSLAIRNTLPESLVISSVCDATCAQPWTEVEANGVYVLNLGISTSSADVSGRITRVPWENGEGKVEGNRWLSTALVQSISL